MYLSKEFNYSTHDSKFYIFTLIIPTTARELQHNIRWQLFFSSIPKLFECLFLDICFSYRIIILFMKSISKLICLQIIKKSFQNSICFSRLPKEQRNNCLLAHFCLTWHMLTFTQ